MAKLYRKYVISKANETSIDPGAQYFVLRLDTDTHARKAMATYINSVMREDKEFANELHDWLVGTGRASTMQEAQV